MKSLVIENLTIKKGDILILKDINLSFSSNNIYGIIGNNGVGKSTLLRALLGLINYSGLISLDNHILNFNSSKEYLKQIGLVMPFPENYGKMSVGEVFDEHLYYMNCILNKNIDTMLSDVGLKISMETKIEELSLGMKQKLNIALALSHNPNILIMDEPFNGLDRMGIKRLKDIINKFKGKNKVILIASHSFSELEDIIDEIIVMNDGEIIATESTSSLKGLGINGLEEYYTLSLEGDSYEK